jgi:hypothetical protein
MSVLRSIPCADVCSWWWHGPWMSVCSFDLWHSLTSLFCCHCSLFWVDDPPLMKVEVEVSNCCIGILPLPTHLVMFTLRDWVFQWWLHMYFQLFFFWINLFITIITVAFFVYFYSFQFKVCFIWDKYNFSCLWFPSAWCSFFCP